MAAADSATEGDEVPSPAFIRKSLGATSSRPADFSGGDEVPNVAAVNPAARPETSAPTQQPAAARSGGDEVPTSAAPAAVPAAPDTSPSKPAATEGSEAPANAVATPAAPPAPVDPIVEQLRELASGKFDRLVGDKEKRAALDAFYSKRSYAPIWITEGKVNDRALAAIDYLGRVDADGLNPADYVVPDVSSMTDPASLAEGELKLSAAVVAYAHHAQVGRVHWTRVSGDIFYDMKASAPADVLANLAGANDVAAALAAYEPQAPGYLALKAKLAELRGNPGGAALPGKIAAGPALKVGMQDARVPLVRQRLGVSGDGDVFDKPLSDAVKKFQQDNNLKAAGTLDAPTVEALNGRHPVPVRSVDLILANMERWRWMPHDLGKTYVLVNIPDYMLFVHQNGRQVWSTRIVDGKPETPTPIISADMKSITDQSDLEHPRHDRRQGIRADDAPGSDHPGADGADRHLQPERHDLYLAAARAAKRARPVAVQSAQQIPGLSARLEREVSVRQAGARHQPRLHADRKSCEICGSSVVDCAAARRLHRRPYPRHVQQSGT